MIWRRFSISEEEASEIIDKVINNTAITAETEQLLALIVSIIRSCPKLDPAIAIKLGESYDDLVEDIAARAWSQLENFHSYGMPLKSFIYSIVFADITDRFRHEEERETKIPRSKMISLFKELANTKERDAIRTYEDILSEEHWTPEQEAIYINMIEQIRKQVKERDGVSSRILELKLKGHTDSEIAKKLGMTPAGIMQIKERVIFPIALEVAKT
jgi:RNA polymerase sigma factor (sigma-70 family)